jgi:predicted RNase H-like nuclease (RuvC/YqgF family)
MNQQEIIYAHKQTIAKLRHENRDLKQCCEELQVINDKLRKDKERLDWLLDENSCNHIERGRYNRLGDWLVKILHNRSDIDKEMEEL